MREPKRRSRPETVVDDTGPGTPVYGRPAGSFTRDRRGDAAGKPEPVYVDDPPVRDVPIPEEQVDTVMAARRIKRFRK